MTTTMSTTTRRALAATIRGLRERLLEQMGEAVEAEYRLEIPPQHADLPEARRERRTRLEQHLRAAEKAGGARARALGAVVEQAAYTLLNRLVFLRVFEARGLVEPKVLTGGWDSPAYQHWRDVAKALVYGDAADGDATRGYAALLDLVFAELAVDLPGLYGPGGLADLVPVRPDTLRAVVEALDAADLAAAWDDELLPGWVYQYWNDPAREALDEKLNAGGKLEPAEIASKTQLFTERYMVDWLLQNSLGPMWLAMCRRHGWTPEVESDGVLAALDKRRADFRAWRDAEVAALDGAPDLDEKARQERRQEVLSRAMPLHGEREHAWAYYVPQEIPPDAVEKAPESLKALKLIDPACGSGHFLVVALRLLVPLLEEEARHRGLAGDPAWQRPALVAHAVAECLHGVDLDPRAVQIAAASLWLEARRLAGEPVALARLNLVASDLNLGRVPADDPAREELRRAVAAEADVPGPLVDRIVDALAQADHLGTLLKIDAAVRAAIEEHEQPPAGEPVQFDLLRAAPAQQLRLDERRRSVEAALDAFLRRHTASDDLGLRLSGQQLEKGVRFVRLVEEGRYDLVVGNPPYQGTSKMADAAYIEEKYKDGKADLYAAFLIRGLELARLGGVSAMLTMRNWMFLSQFAELRQWLLREMDLRALGDFAIGAFDEVPNDLLSVAVSVFRRTQRGSTPSVASQPTPPGDASYDRGRTPRKRAATLAGVGRFEFQVADFSAVTDSPLIYWWTPEFRRRFSETPKLAEVAPAKFGINTGNNVRFLRWRWELPSSAVPSLSLGLRAPVPNARWHRYLKGAAGLKWMDPCDEVAFWNCNGLAMKAFAEFLYGSYSRQIRNEDCYFGDGIAFTMMGATFAARLHRWRCIIDSKGSSLYPADPARVLCQMNTTAAKEVLSALNPTVSFQVGDVNRLPLFPVADADTIYATIEQAFAEHESHREPSVEFRRPGPSPWRHAQAWAQQAVDRPEGAPLPPYAPEYDAEPATDHVGFALGVALGRFDADGGGVLDPATADLSRALPAGTLFLDGTLPADERRDGLGHPACAPLHAAWTAHGAAIAGRRDLRTYLRLKFFDDVHRALYENKPIHWPLSSAKKTFVAWVNIHRMNAQTLPLLVADHLVPTLRRLEGTLEDLRRSDDAAAQARYADLQKARDELTRFIADVRECAEKGPPPPNAKVPPRDADARYDPDLDDGVMINAAALWPLLAPQWKYPAEWWTELARAKDRKDYDWSVSAR